MDELLASLLVAHGVGTEYEAHHRVVAEGLAEDVDHLGYVIPAETEDRLKLARRIHPAQPAMRDASNVQVLHVPRVLLDELASWFYLVPHEPVEQFVGDRCVFDLDL